LWTNYLILSNLMEIINFTIKHIEQRIWKETFMIAGI